jgi:uncharacterized protein
MRPNRRTFLASLAAATTLPRLSWADVGSPAWLAAAAEPEGGYALYGLSAVGETRFRVPLPARGHAATAHPERPEAVAFARRPGTFALVIDCTSGAVLAALTPPAGRQFNGHGAYSMDGSILYTSEVVAEGSSGRIGLWDANRGYARLAEWETGGLGPHEIRRLPGRETLVVANGGIQTDPSDRTPLNIETMRANLAYLSPEGDIAELVELAPDLAQNSIRHLALGPAGLVAFCMQWQGDPAEDVPLMGLHRQGAAPVLATLPEAETFTMKGYAGSVAFDAAGERVAITSPKGGRVQIYSSAGQFLTSVLRTDVCGLGADAAGGFILTDGHGFIASTDGQVLRPLQQAACAWDNHLVALT